MKTFSRTCFYVYWFLPILILSGEVLSAKGKLKIVKKLRSNNTSDNNGPLPLHSHHSPVCPGPHCKSNGELEEKNRLKRNNNFPGGVNGGVGHPQWSQQQPNFPQFNQPNHHSFPHDNLMPNPQQAQPGMDMGHFEPSAAPQQMQQLGGGMMPMARSDNGQGIDSGGPSGFNNPNNFQGPTGPFVNQPGGNNEFQGPPAPGGFPQNPLPVPLGTQPESTGFQLNNQPPHNGIPPTQQQARFGEPMEHTGFQDNNFQNNFQNNGPPAPGQNFQGPPQPFNNNNNQQPMPPNSFPPNQFHDPNANAQPQFPQNNNVPVDQMGAASFQQQSFNNGEMGFPQGDPNQQNPFPFPPTDMNNNNNFPFPNNNQPQQMNLNSFMNNPSPDNMNRDLSLQGGPQNNPGNPMMPFANNGNNQNPMMMPNAPFPNQLGQPMMPNNSSFYSPRTNAESDSGDDYYNNNNNNEGYDESETQVSNYHDDYYEDDYYKKKHSTGLFKKHKGKLNEDHVVSIVVQVARKIISSYIFVFVANMLIGFLGKATGLSNSYVETHITLGNDGKHPFGHYADNSKGHASSYGSPGAGAAGGSKKGTYALSNGLYHPATALYQHPTYQYNKGGKDYTLLGYDQYHAVKYAKKYSKKYAKKAGKYGLRPKPIGPYLPAYQYGLPPGPLALGWTAGSGGPNGFYKRTGTSQEPMKASDDKKNRYSDKNTKDKAAGRNGDGITLKDSSKKNSTEIEESEEDEEESDEYEEASTLLSVGNETLSVTTIPPTSVESNSTNLNETSVEENNLTKEERDDSNSIEENNDEVTTTLLPMMNISDEDNDIVKASTTDATAVITSTASNITNNVTSSTTSASTTVATRIETADGLYTFKTGTRGNSRIFSSLKTK